VRTTQGPNVDLRLLTAILEPTLSSPSLKIWTYYRRHLLWAQNAEIRSQVAYTADIFRTMSSLLGHSYQQITYWTPGTRSSEQAMHEMKRLKSTYSTGPINFSCFQFQVGYPPDLTRQISCKRSQALGLHPLINPPVTIRNKPILFFLVGRGSDRYRRYYTRAGISISCSGWSYYPNSYSWGSTINWGIRYVLASAIYSCIWPMHNLTGAACGTREFDLTSPCSPRSIAYLVFNSLPQTAMS